MLDKLGVFLCRSASVEERGWVWACLEGWEGKALWGGRMCEPSVFGVWWGNNKAIVVFGGREGGREKEREGIKDFDLFLSPDPCPAPSLGFCHLRSICLMAAQEMKTFRMPRAPISLALREN